MCGVGAQLLAVWLRVPGLLALLATGFVVGPVTGVLDPDEMFGDLLFPGVALAVGLLLFDGGLQLDFQRIRTWRSTTARLVTIGVVITWVIGSLTIDAVTDLNGRTAWLAGAVLVVSGPTVVVPLLRRIMPSPPSEDILEWEGILIDPIGAVLGLVMLDVVVSGDGAGDAFWSLVAISGTGIAAGLGGAALAMIALRIPDLHSSLRAPVALAAAVAAYAVANLVAVEAGLFATTLVGICLANQRATPTQDIAAFEEGIGVLAIGSLFIVLGARVPVQGLSLIHI